MPLKLYSNSSADSCLQDKHRSVNSTRRSSDISHTSDPAPHWPNLINCNHLQVLSSRGKHNKPLRDPSERGDTTFTSGCMNTQSQVSVDPGCKVSAWGWAWFLDMTRVPINHSLHLVKLNLVLVWACCHYSWVSFAVINYITTKVRAGAERNRRSELHQLRVIYPALCQSISLCLLPFLHYSAWITCVWDSECVCVCTVDPDRDPVKMRGLVMSGEI